MCIAICIRYYRCIALSHTDTYTCRAFEVDMDQLCKGNNDTKFRIECWDEDTLEDNHNLIGRYYNTPSLAYFFPGPINLLDIIYFQIYTKVIFIWSSTRTA